MFMFSYPERAEAREYFVGIPIHAFYSFEAWLIKLLVRHCLFVINTRVKCNNDGRRETQSGIAVGAYVGLGSSSRSLVGRGSRSPTPRFSYGSGSPYTPLVVATPSEASCALEGGAIHSEAS